MCCFFTIIWFLGPRVGLVIWWLFRPMYYQFVFNGWLMPLLGLLFLPWTTLMYLIVYGSNGIVGWDWAWLVLALLTDLGSYGGGAYGNRGRVLDQRSA